MAIIIINEHLFVLTHCCFSQSFVDKQENCSRTEQISRHSPTITASDANFMQSAPKEELSLDQAVNQRTANHARFT